MSPKTPELGLIQQKTHSQQTRQTQSLQYYIALIVSPKKKFKHETADAVVGSCGCAHDSRPTRKHALQHAKIQSKGLHLRNKNEWTDPKHLPGDATDASELLFSYSIICSNVSPEPFTRLHDRSVFPGEPHRDAPVINARHISGSVRDLSVTAPARSIINYADKQRHVTSAHLELLSHTTPETPQGTRLRGKGK